MFFSSHIYLKCPQIISLWWLASSTDIFSSNGGENVLGTPDLQHLLSSSSHHAIPESTLTGFLGSDTLHKPSLSQESWLIWLASSYASHHVPHLPLWERHTYVTASLSQRQKMPSRLKQAMLILFFPETAQYRRAIVKHTLTITRYSKYLIWILFPLISI